MSDDKENDGHGPADPRAVDHGRALQTLSTDNRSDVSISTFSFAVGIIGVLE